MTILFISRKDGGVSLCDLSHLPEDKIERAVFLATHYGAFDPETGDAVLDEEGKPIFKKYEWIVDFWLGSKDSRPQDTHFRDSWISENGAVKVCMNRAKVQHMKNVRSERAKKFIEMGFPYKLNEDLEAAIVPQETRDKLQALRDIPQTFDLSAATTPEELKALWPDELKGDQ